MGSKVRCSWLEFRFLLSFVLKAARPGLRSAAASSAIHPDVVNSASHALPPRFCALCSDSTRLMPTARQIFESIRATERKKQQGGLLRLAVFDPSFSYEFCSESRSFWPPLRARELGYSPGRR